MNNKLWIIALIVLSLFMLASCSNNSENVVENAVELDEFLIRESISLTCFMDELAESEEFIDLVAVSDNIEQITDKMATQDYSMPKDVYLIKLDDDMILKAIKGFSGDINIPDNILEKLKYKINGSIFANIINASYGSEMIAASSITTWEESYIEPDGWSDNMILLLEYPGEFSSLVSFGESGDNVISATSVFIKNGDEDILSLLSKYLGVTDIDYDHYSGSQLEELF